MVLLHPFPITATAHPTLLFYSFNLTKRAHTFPSLTFNLAASWSSFTFMFSQTFTSPASISNATYYKISSCLLPPQTETEVGFVLQPMACSPISSFASLIVGFFYRETKACGRSSQGVLRKPTVTPTKWASSFSARSHEHSHTEVGQG